MNGVAFVVYDDSGAILRRGVCPASVVQAQAASGQFVLEGNGNDRDHCVWQGEIMDKVAARTLGWPG